MSIDTLAVVGIGTDLLDSKRIADVYERQQQRFVERILTPKERELFNLRGQSVNFLAKQFAAKEALAKALGTGIAKGIGFQELEVLRSAEGAPVVYLYGTAQVRLMELNAANALVSLSDEGEFVLAFAVLSR